MRNAQIDSGADRHLGLNRIGDRNNSVPHSAPEQGSDVWRRVRNESGKSRGYLREGTVDEVAAFDAEIP